MFSINNLEKINIFGVYVHAVNLKLASQFLEKCIELRQKTYVCVAPVSTIVDCQKDKKYRDVVNKAGMVTPDGMPVVWIGKLKGNQTIERTYGPDVMRYFFSLSQDKGYRHYFYGSTPSTLDKLESNLKNTYSRLDIVGSFSPPMRDIGALENQEILNQINKVKPDVLWVGLGSPKQDFWMVNHRDKLDVPVMIGVGAAFDFLAGTKPQAPVWMQRSGLEWIFRLCSEPKRLWKRYLVGNSLFVFLVIKELLQGKLFKIQ